MISFTLSESTLAEITINNILGERVRTLPTVLLEKDKPRTVYWDEKGKAGAILKNGIYLYQLKVNDKVYQTKQAMILR